MSAERTIGYIGVDVLNNATICNEATGLLDAGVELQVASVYRFSNPTFYKDSTLAKLAGRIEHLYPLGWIRMIIELILAPFVFGGGFFGAIGGALSCPAEGFKQRLRLLFHLLPAIRLAMLWREKSIGHIHAHWAHTATTVAMHTAKLLGISFSFTGHANDLFVHRVGLEGKVRRARFIVCISEYHRRFYLDLGADPERLQVVYCGIDLGRFTSTSGPVGEIEEPGPLSILSVGRLVEKKGFHDLIEACGLLRDRGVYFKCTIAGSGPWEDRLRKTIADLDLHKYVTVTGKIVLQEDLPALLQTAAVFALPCVRDAEGDMDGLPQVLIESMASAVPAVSTWLVGIPDLIRHESNGLLVPSGNVNLLADELHRIIADDKLRHNLASAAEIWAREYFGRGETVRRLKTLFNWAASTPGNAPADFQFPPAPGSEACYDVATSSISSKRVLIISPAKDESQYIRRTIQSMVAQTHRPTMWIIVDDGSTDGMGEIADEAARRHDWIKVVHREKGTARRVGPGVIDAFYEGLSTVDLKDYDYVCKFDADVEFQPGYFEEMLRRFESNPRLGTASGKCYTPVGELDDGRELLALERIRDDISVGLAKLYRRRCFEEIGGFVREVMWDGIDCHRCRQLGWEAASYGDPELALVHLRLMGSSSKSIYHGRRRWGYGQYYMGTHPLYLLAISTYRMAERPWILGGLNIFYGYVAAWLRRAPRYENKEFRKHLRSWQMKELSKLLRTRKQCTAPRSLIYARQSPDEPRESDKLSGIDDLATVGEYRGEKTDKNG